MIKSRNILDNIWLFCMYVWQRGQLDSVRQWAASLTYTSLLAFVPLLSVSLAIFSAFPTFQNFKQSFLDYVFINFAPSEQMGAMIQSYFNSFVSATGSLPALGVVFLVVTSVLLLLTISIAFNRIWHVKRTQSLINRLLVFWAVLTLVPILMGAGLSIFPIIQNIIAEVTGEVIGQEEAVKTTLNNLITSRFFFPVIFEILALLVLFMVVPNTPVPFKDALWGALGGAVALEILKAGFGLYLSRSNFTNIYGALAIVPIFLLWVFTCWNIVLFAAVSVASLPEWRAGMRRVKDIKVDVYNQFDTALSVFNAVWEKQQYGGRVSEGDIIKKYKLTPWLVYTVLPVLEQNGWIQRVNNTGWVLARDLDTIKLYALFELFISDSTHNKDENIHNWDNRLTALMQDVRLKRRDIMDESIEAFFLNKSSK